VRTASLTAVAALLVASPSIAHAGSHTVDDVVGDVVTGPEISDIVTATVIYSPRRLRITLTHAFWQSVVERQRSATGASVVLPGGRSFIIGPNVTGRRSLVGTTRAYFGGGDASGVRPCSGARYRIDAPSLTTEVSVPMRCFGLSRLPQRVQVQPFHALRPVVTGQQPVIDRIEGTPWIARG
jgi:hypothetical protein